MNIILENKRVNQFIFTTRVAGANHKPAIIFLHGFPESSHMWERLMKELSTEYFCIAPNMRGYSAGARPRGKKHYKAKLLAKDILDLADAYGIDKMHLVGHDWGSMVGWTVIDAFPERILSWTSLSVPPIQAFADAIFNDPKQKQMSSYIRTFMIPWLPEFKIKQKDFKIFRRLWKNSSEEEVSDYLDVFRQRGALTAALNYYRGNAGLLQRASREQVFKPVQTPTLFIWGKNDPAIGPFGVEKGHEHIKGPYTFLPLDGGHWLIQTNYEDVRDAITKHVTAQ